MLNNLTLWTAIIQIISSIILAFFTIGLWWATNEQKNIAKQEKDLNLFKLRVKHYHKLIELWTLYSSYFVENKEFCDTFYNRKTFNDRVADFQKVNHELIILNAETKFLFNESIYNIENKLLQYFNNVQIAEAYDKDLVEGYLKNKKCFKGIVEQIALMLNIGVKDAK